ncbi:Uncharacterized protein C30D11.14c [Hypsizygus marmoreus]|uniref:Uncharacterized protein C30D11.14c n=1 Tax=Hypsizygus marmoreus TaxID=39966 RepID=A0A369J982_HYPMA|nr:Uncharacterized protein C30D11.14c [Hypsizygus marmoreus]
MSSKRKWDQTGLTEDESPSPTKLQKSEEKESKTASDAAAAAAAIAAKIAAQFASGALGNVPGGKDLHGGDYTKDIDINDVRNRYMLTKGSTQTQINEETGASVSTKGVWYPDRSKATDKDPPLYLHIAAATPEILQKAIVKVNELIAFDLGSLVEDKKDRLREKRKWPEEKLPVGLESIRNFNVRAKVVGPSGSFVKYIQHETGARVQIKGIGSGFVDQETGRESDEPLYIHITSPEEGQVARAKILTEDLLLVVRSEHAKMQAIIHQQQMELHQAQVQYAAYSAMAGYAPPPSSNAPPPPPPGDQPPPPPDANGAASVAGYDPTQAHAAAGGAPPAGTDAASQDAYAAYWAAYGYDVNSPQFKEWAASQQQQFSQYYAAQGYAGAASSATTSAPAPPGEAAPPPPTA